MTQSLIQPPEPLLASTLTVTGCWGVQVTLLYWRAMRPLARGASCTPDYNFIVVSYQVFLTNAVTGYTAMAMKPPRENITTIIVNPDLGPNIRHASCFFQAYVIQDFFGHAMPDTFITQK